MVIEKLEFGKYYHIFNRGNNHQNIFFETENYYHFLRLMDRYIDPICEVYAWALLKNHFHLLVYIKEENDIDINNLYFSVKKTTVKINISQQFSNWFNAYTKAINKRYNRSGSLLEKPFERKQVDHESYFQKLIYYIHNNPVKHGFVSHPVEYPWTSYLSILSEKETKLKRERVIHFFNNKANFIQVHQQQLDLTEIEKLMME